MDTRPLKKCPQPVTKVSTKAREPLHEVFILENVDKIVSKMWTEFKDKTSTLKYSDLNKLNIIFPLCGHCGQKIKHPFSTKFHYLVEVVFHSQ